MEDTLFWSRLQFAFTVAYHYLFPQLTMGLAWILVYFKWRHWRGGGERYGEAARFWGRIFGVNFAVGVVTGIPMEFQFGTNWAGFSRSMLGRCGRADPRDGRDVRVFPGELLSGRRIVWGEKKPRAQAAHPFLAALVALASQGSWLSGYFIRGDQRVHAASDRPCAHPGGEPSIGELSGRSCSTRGRSLNMLMHDQTASAGHGRRL